MRGSDDSSGSLFGYVDLESGARPYEKRRDPTSACGKRRSRMTRCQYEPRREPDVEATVGEGRPWRQGAGGRLGCQSKTMRSILTTACIALSAVAMACPAHADVSGRAQVIDGDTIDVAGTRIRLFGIDAPERGQGSKPTANYGSAVDLQ